MEEKVFLAKSMKEAIQAIKEDLGADAMILSAKELLADSEGYRVEVRAASPQPKYVKLENQANNLLSAQATNILAPNYGNKKLKAQASYIRQIAGLAEEPPLLEVPLGLAGKMNPKKNLMNSPNENFSTDIPNKQSNQTLEYRKAFSSLIHELSLLKQEIVKSRDELQHNENSQKENSTVQERVVASLKSEIEELRRELYSVKNRVPITLPTSENLVSTSFFDDFKKEFSVIREDTKEIFEKIESVQKEIVPLSKKVESFDFESFQHILEPLVKPIELSNRYNVPLRMGKIFSSLLKSGLRVSTIQEILEKAQKLLGSSFHDDELLQTTKNIMNEKLTMFDETMDFKKIMVYLGPSGSGKTSLIAKAAAKSKIQDSKKIGIISVDTYKIAAIEQMRRYAEILDIPFEVATSPEIFRELTDKYKDLEIIFVDTAGRSPFDFEKIHELKNFFSHQNDISLHLVIPAVTSYEDLETIVENFAFLPVRTMAVTRSDETKFFGKIYDILSKTRLPLSYLGTGQQIPEDIFMASRKFLVDLVFDPNILKLHHEAKHDLNKGKP